MRIRGTVLAAWLSVLPFATALGQGGPAAGQGMGERRMQALMQGITLTAQQQAQVDSIRAQIRAQMPPFTPGSPPDPAQMQLRRSLTARQDSLVRAVLSPEQQRVFDTNLANLPRRPGS
jgi:Spy/CpxP family protein refolding chaperone